MKKLIALVTVIVLMLSCTACGTLPQEKTKDAIDQITSLVSDAVENNMSNFEDASDLIDDVTSMLQQELENQHNNTTSKEDTTSNEETESKEDIVSKEETASKEDTVSKEENNTTTNIFFNDNNKGFTYNSLTVNPRYVYWKDGNLYAECFLINGYSTNAHTISFPELKFSNEDGVIASGNFGVLQNVVIQPYTYYIHTFIFSGEAVDNYGADLSHLYTSASFDLYY